MKRTFNILFLCGSIFTLVGIPFVIIDILMAANFSSLQAHGTGDIWLLPVLFTSLGTICSVIGIFLLWTFHKRQVVKKRLIQNNYYVMAEIVDEVPDWSVRVNGCPGRRLICRYEDPSTGRIYEFVSDVFFTGMFSQVGGGVKVYVDKNDFGNYYVDLGH